MTTLNKELRKVLISLGANEDEADAAAASVISGDQAATKDDLRIAIAELRQATSTDIAELRQATKTDIAEVKAALSELRQATRADLAEFKAEVRKWMLVQTLAILVAVAAIVKL